MLITVTLKCSVLRTGAMICEMMLPHFKTIAVTSVTTQRRNAINKKSEWEIDYLKEYHINGNQKCVLCAETQHIPDGTSEMYTVHWNNIFQTVHQKCVLCTETTLSRRYIRNVYCAQKQNTFQTVHQKCVLCTETQHFPDGTSETCTVYRNRTLSIWYIRNVYCAQKQHFPDGTLETCTEYRNNTFRTVHQKCVLSAATCCQFTLLTWPTVPTAHWHGEVTNGNCGTK
jgi:hypothetical protein